jgi:hypothetical protein
MRAHARRVTFAVVAALALAAGTSTAAQAQTSLAGTWELDRFKSV